MRLDFNILWVEDQPNQVNAQRESIERRMRNEGFKLQTEFANSVGEAENFLSENVFRDHVDLVLMDYELAGDTNGGEGLEVVREWCPYKDIVFYSAVVPTKLKGLVAENEISGVFCAHRNDLTDTVMGIFGILVKKVLDIDHSRGIVMGATSEIDHFINLALEAFLSKSDAATKELALGIAQKQIAKIRADFEHEFEELQALSDPTGLKSFHRSYTSVKRLILLRKLLKASGREDIDIQSMIEYEQTLPRRNMLAHVTVERSGFARRILDKTGSELTVEDMRTLRVELLKHHENFESLLQTL